MTTLERKDEAQSGRPRVPVRWLDHRGNLGACMSDEKDDALLAYFERATPDWCGLWALRWAARGQDIEVPRIASLRHARAVDVLGEGRAYAQKLGLSVKLEPTRGDIGVFAVDDRFEKGFAHVVGIFAGDGLWAFMMRRGVKFLRVDPLEVWG